MKRFLSEPLQRLQYELADRDLGYFVETFGCQMNVRDSEIIAGMLEKFQSSRIVQDAFSFIRPAVTGLIAAAGWSVFEIALFNVGVSFGTINWLAVAIFAAVLICTQLKKLKKLHPIVFILAGAVLGIIFQM